MKPESIHNTLGINAIPAFRVKDSPHPSLLRPLGCFSPQDDKTIKCWGLNDFGLLGQGDRSTRGDDANGPRPPSSVQGGLM